MKYTSVNVGSRQMAGCVKVPSGCVLLTGGMSWPHQSPKLRQWETGKALPMGKAPRKGKPFI